MLADKIFEGKEEVKEKWCYVKKKKKKKYQFVLINVVL